MAINDKLEIIKTGVLDVRDALKEFDHSLGQGNITTIVSDISSLASNSIIILYEDEEGNYKYKCIHVAGTTCPSFQNTDLIPGKIISVILPKSITLIPNRCFNGQNKLEYINLANVKTFQRDYNFENCNLKKITIGNIQNTSLASVGLFKNNTNLEEVVFLNKDYNLNFGNDCFAGCSNLKTVKIASLEGWLLNTNHLGPSTHRLYDLSGNEYTEIVIPDTITSLHAPGFERFNNITSITIPDSVTSIGAGAFQGCTALTSITIPDSVNFTGSDVFRDCLLDEMTFKGRYTTTSGTQQPFRYYSALKKLNIDPDKYFLSVPVVDYNYNNISPNSNSTNVRLYNIKTGEEITDVILPNGATVWNQIFKNCINLVSVNIPEGVTTIGQAAFRGCINLVSVNIPEGVTTFGNNGNNSIFVGCRKIHDFTLPSTLNWTNSTYYNLIDLGDGTGTFTSNSGYRSGGNQTSNGYYFLNYIINGDVINEQQYNRGMLNSVAKYIKVNGNLIDNSANGSWFFGTREGRVVFIEISGTISGTGNNVLVAPSNNAKHILHLSYNGIAGNASRFTNATKIYVGNGSSQQYDQDILNQYLADDDWNELSDKLDIWYNYVGEYKEPSENVTFVDYLECDGNQYIETERKVTETTKMSIDAQYNDIYNDIHLAGTMGSNDARFQIEIYSGNHFFGLYDKTTAVLPQDTDRHTFTIDCSSKTVSVDSTAIQLDCNVSSISQRIILGARMTAAWAVNSFFKGRIYESKIWENNTLVQDLVPARIGNLGVMYDTVTNKIFYNLGDQPFIVGPDKN